MGTTSKTKPHYTAASTAEKPCTTRGTAISRTEIVEVDYKQLQGDIRRYYPRCFSHEVAGKERGSKNESTRRDNRQKVTRMMMELYACDWNSDVNLEEYKPHEIRFAKLAAVQGGRVGDD